MELFLKNGTSAEIAINDLGIVIAAGQSITIDENDIDGYLTADLIAALGTNSTNGLILSTTDVGNTSGDFPQSVAIERLTLKTHWKPAVSTYSSLPSIGNESGDLRLVIDVSIVYMWNTGTAAWVPLTSGGSLTVEEYDGSPSGTNIIKLIFCDLEDSVFIDGTSAYIGPPNAPLSMSGQALSLSGSSLYTGRLSDLNPHYKPGDPAGTNVNYITNDAVFALISPNSSRCNYGDRGVISFYLNSAKLATIDLAANFNETNRATAQSIASYNTTGTGDPISSGVANFTGAAAGKGSFQILSVGQFSGFALYQIFQGRANITDASIFQQGYNSMYMTHEGLTSYGGTQTSATFEIFYDTDTTSPSVDTPTATDGTSSYKWLSGVKYYGAGSTWNVGFVVSNGFDNVYHSSNAPVTLSGWPGLTTTAVPYTNGAVSGVSTPPQIGETMTVANWTLTQASNVYSTNARVIATPQDPYNTYTSHQSDSNNILIWSYGSSSTELIEEFRDEDYRLPAGSYDTIPTTITAQWDSTQNIGTWSADTTGLQCYIDELYFPTLDFTTFKPTGNPDYSVLASGTNRTYYRAFRSTSASHASGILRMTGITKAQLYARNIRVYIKAPTQTGWLDLTRDYNFATYQGIDNDGCWVNRDIQTNSDFQFTLGTFYTQFSGFMIIVKVVYPSSSAPRMNYMGITNW